jgi:hypothetical protein
MRHWNCRADYEEALAQWLAEVLLARWDREQAGSTPLRAGEAGVATEIDRRMGAPRLPSPPSPTSPDDSRS